MLSVPHGAGGELRSQGHRHAAPSGEGASPAANAGGRTGLPCRPVHGVDREDAAASSTQQRSSGSGGAEAHVAPLSIVIQRGSIPALPAALLHNPSQICYINSCAQALNWVCLLTGAPRQCGGKASFALHALNKSGRTCVLHHLAWHALLTGWGNIHRQHDAGSFMSHLLERALPSAFLGTWQARLDFPHMVVDEGLLRTPIMIELQGATLQALITHWSLQHTIHALDSPRGVVMFQLKRYDFVNGGAVKNHHPIPLEPGMLIQLPIFGDEQGLRLVHRHFRVVFVVYHLGPWVDQGHYQTALSVPNVQCRPEVGSDFTWGFHICNDGSKPRMAQPRDIQLINTNAYIVGLVLREGCYTKHFVPGSLRLEPTPLCSAHSLPVGWQLHRCQARASGTQEMLRVFGSIARVIPFPTSLHCEVLEERLILRAFRERWMQQQGSDIYPAMTMLSRNDIIAEALRTLHHPHLRSFLMYVESLAEALPGGDTTAYPAMPQAVCSSEGNVTAAERAAMLLLAEGEGSIWHAVRQVITELPFAPHRRSFNSAQLCFRLGAYGHRSFVGLHAATAQHSAVCTLLNAFIRMIHPGHEWTSLSVQVDSLAGPHRDHQNYGLNLVVGVSLFEQGQLWIEHDRRRTILRRSGHLSCAGSSHACQRQRCPIRCSPLLARSQTMVWW